MATFADYLNPRRKLVDAVAEWLCGRVVKTPSGAHTLDHLMVIVPTSQAGRNLRLTLARKAAEKGWGGLVPPRVVLPFHLVAVADRTVRDASEAELAALFLKFLELKKDQALTVWPHLFQRSESPSDLQALVDKEAGFALLDQMADIWRVLASKGLLMQDVPANENAAEVLAAAQGDDGVRWNELASFEKMFFDFLREKGLRHPTESVALAKKAAAPLDEGIEEIVLPALADPVFVLMDVLEQHARKVRVTTLFHCDKTDRALFDDWGRPCAERWTGVARPQLDALTDADIVSLPDDKTLAARLVDDFPDLDSNLALPTLGLCDSELFTEVSAAFLNAGRQVDNPERNRLAVSSLGMLLGNLLPLWRPSAAGMPWAPFAALFRSDDILLALEAAGAVKSRSQVLDGLDVYQNKCLPTFLGNRIEMPALELHANERMAVGAFADGADLFLAWLAEARKMVTLVGFVREMLRRVFLNKEFSDWRGTKEFAKAADGVRTALGALSGEVIEGLGLSPADQVELARRTLEATSYSLESDSGDVVRTEGWLELPWSLGDQIALVGLHEGAVPDSVVGHAFLPNELRASLGLMTNETRLARDTWLLKELVDSHETHAIRAYVSRTNGKGDICRPSRLLFMCSDESLVARVRSLFGDMGDAAVTPRREVSPAWRFRLPDEVPLCQNSLGEAHLSASSIDTYLKSPFEYLLKYGLGMRDRQEEKQELGFDDYGLFVHRVLEIAAFEQKKEPLTDEQRLATRLKGILEGEAARFGSQPTLNVRLQLRSASDRLMRFAKIQAEWAQAGWQVEGAEIRYSVKPFADLDVLIQGSVDRVDYRESPDGTREFRIIDYKTWDCAEDANKHIKTKASAEIDFARVLALPTESFTKDKKGQPERMLTIQLPLYGACLKALDPKRFAGPVTEYDYLVLAEDKVKVVSVKKEVDLSLRTARAAIERIKGNIFWPPRADEKGRLYDFARLFSISPELDLGVGEGKSAWLIRQEAKLKELSNG